MKQTKHIESRKMKWNLLILEMHEIIVVLLLLCITSSIEGGKTQRRRL